MWILPKFEVMVGIGDQGPAESRFAEEKAHVVTLRLTKEQVSERYGSKVLVPAGPEPKPVNAAGKFKVDLMNKDLKE